MAMKTASLKVKRVARWFQEQPRALTVAVAAFVLISVLVALNLYVRDHAKLYFAAEATHSLGVVILLYRAIKKRTCSGLSLRSQELTALFLVARMPGMYFTGYHVFTAIDAVAAIATASVVYLMRFKLRATYNKELDNMSSYYTVVPAAVLAVLVHPPSDHGRLVGVFWAFSVYLKTVSVWPQLHLIKNEKTVEPITAHYVFALGVARFLSFAHWAILVYVTRGVYLFLIGGFMWILLSFISEIVYAFILVDFCYYYVKR
ncbi:hypothetical protein NMG60_11036711 [Bertholletia excelsa]